MLWCFCRLRRGGSNRCNDVIIHLYINFQDCLYTTLNRPVDEFIYLPVPVYAEVD